MVELKGARKEAAGLRAAATGTRAAFPTLSQRGGDMGLPVGQVVGRSVLYNQPAGGISQGWRTKQAHMPSLAQSVCGATSPKPHSRSLASCPVRDGRKTRTSGAVLNIILTSMKITSRKCHRPPSSTCCMETARAHREPCRLTVTAESNLRGRASRPLQNIQENTELGQVLRHVGLNGQL